MYACRVPMDPSSNDNAEIALAKYAGHVTHGPGILSRSRLAYQIYSG